MVQSRALSSYLVTPSELHSALKANPKSRIATSPRTVPLCASWFLPTSHLNGYETFRQRHIPDSRFFDLDATKDERSPYPHMLPSAELFANAMGKMGISKGDVVVVYDSAEMGIFSAPRVAWTLRVFGHPNTHVLNNFKLYVEQGYPVEEGEQGTYEQVEYPVPELDARKVVAFEEVREVAKDHGKEGSEEVQILDARPKGRWAGTDAEPRPGLPSGHIPGSISVPMSDVLDPKTKTFLPSEALKKLFESKGIDRTKRIISSCGTGVTAAVIDAALAEAGYKGSMRRLYDGSWTEWAQRVRPSENMIVTGET
ncbi:hypothetical protein B0A49_12831 [Cryomyces minteri]|uniref:Rhodanese domain-containing protein n=1 Tax=Cryomyces minteri TaxID=331657 RepID=A0A4U0VRV1_9PEZI|nr:hypothetical protein B0A49_12831 [Cryomyces minteri]